MSKFSKLQKLLKNTDVAKKTVSHGITKPDDFHSALAKARGADKRVEDYTHLYSPEEYAQMKTFLSPDGKSGFAIKPDGDIVSAFSTERGGGRLDNIMRTALSEGGTKLDAFDKLPTESKGLPDLYSKYGFKQVKREPNWTKGAPDVVYMEHPSANLLKKIDTPEKAVALKGKEREEYLKALDDVYGSQSQRAKDMGFGDETFYHGTTKDFDKFSKSNLGDATKAPSAGEGFFFGKNPDTANSYIQDKLSKSIESSNIDSVVNNLEKQIDAQSRKLDSIYKNRKPLRGKTKESDDVFADLFRDPDSKKFAEEAEILKNLRKEYKKLNEYPYEDNAKILPVRLRSSNPLEVDYKGDPYRETSFYDQMIKGKDAGNDSVVFKNAIDSSNIKRTQQSGIVDDINAVFEPNQIRSTNAAFDPRFKDSDLILASRAGVLGAGIGAATLGGNSEAEAANPKRIEELTKYLKDNPEMAQNFFNKFKYFNKEARDLQKKIPQSDKFEDLMSDRIIRDPSKAPELVKEIENKRELAFDHLDALKQSGYDVVHKRGQRGRTDKPFEEKIKMVNPETGKQLKLVDDSPSTIGKVLHSLGVPQRRMLNTVAEQMGVKGNIEDSEESSRAIVQNIADRMNLPEDSSLVNAGKALGVAGLEVFADPVNAIGIGPAVKLGKRAAPALKAVANSDSVTRLKNLFKADPKRFEAIAESSPELAETVNKLKDSTPLGAVDASIMTNTPDVASPMRKLRPDVGYGAVGTRDRFEQIRKMLGK